ncbi:Hypothetical predicted protein [Mytilus galloprovincialis]|uniref:B box-type domain-containing protein n=1 Tax=Mytilus galloprovincialis TaxID=29158 RepID=A0A8B6E5L4_MYTGA|nr:Hypothetical predicted protein [Mytilus galloprovincialis]
MAVSNPQLGIQSPIQCQLCVQDKQISFKCLECDLLMCSACKNDIHPKIKTATEHRIIHIKDIGKTSIPRTNIGSASSSNKDNNQTSDPSKECTNVHVTVVEEYQTKIKEVSQLALGLDDSFWLGDGDHQKGMRLFTSHTGLQKVKCERNKLKVLSSFNIDICGLAVTHGNDLLIATDGPILKQIKNGKTKIEDTAYNLNPYNPQSIYITRKNKVIVGARNNTKNKGVVIVMDNLGNHERVYGKDKTKDISFTLPWNITATNNDNIFVIDVINDKMEGRVVLLGQVDIVNTYSGHPDINTKAIPFTPIDLTTTPTDNVIVVEMINNTLHIINNSGQLITYISTKYKGISLPCSISLAMVGHFCMLYIGTYTDENNKDKAKLYKLNLIGC